MKWVKTGDFIKCLGLKYSYAFAKGIMLINSFDSGITIALKVKDVKTAKQIAGLLEK